MVPVSSAQRELAAALTGDGDAPAISIRLALDGRRRDAERDQRALFERLAVLAARSEITTELRWLVHQLLEPRAKESAFGVPTWHDDLGEIESCRFAMNEELPSYLQLLATAHGIPRVKDANAASTFAGQRHAALRSAVKLEVEVAQRTVPSHPRLTRAQDLQSWSPGRVPAAPTNRATVERRVAEAELARDFAAIGDRERAAAGQRSQRIDGVRRRIGAAIDRARHEASDRRTAAALDLLARRLRGEALTRAMTPLQAAQIVIAKVRLVIPAELAGTQEAS